ncbi:MAG: YbhB/YbcL family Raf kinase inhibitor-like protein, partial [Gammaproteobacteria bacterium]
GGNLSPALSWSNPPAGTKSYALMVYDPDAPTGSGWWHWVVWNIPANAQALPARAGDPAARLMPAGVMQGNTDFGTAGYGGPCPPPGDKPHRYYFRLHALKVDKLELPPNATAALVGYNVRANSLGVAELMATYGR